MKPYILPVLGLSLAGAIVSPSFAQTTEAPANAPASTNAAARKLLAESAAAYAALNSYSSKVEVSQPPVNTVSSGVFTFARPNKARLEFTGPGRVLRAVQDGKEFHLQNKADSYFSNSYPETANITGVWSSSATIATTYINRLLKGQNPFDAAIHKNTELTLTTVDGVSRVTAPYPLGANNVGELTLDFDPTDKLLRVAQLKATLQDKPYLNKTVFSEVKVNPTLAEDAFTFVAAPGVKKLTAEEANAYWDLRLKPGTAPFPLSGKDLDGKERSLEQYKGKVLLIDFWATWCGPCVAEIPNVQAKYDQYKAQGFDVLAVSLDNTKDPLTKFVADKKLAWPQIYDKESPESLAKRYGVQAIPFVLLIGKDGNIAAVNPRGEKLEPAIKEALAK